MRLGFAILLLATGCASYGLHRPAHVLEGGQGELAVSLDVVKFWSRIADEERSADRLDVWTLVPELHYRRGLGARTEVDVALLPVGIRGGLRLQALGTGTTQGAGTVEIGCTVAGGLGKTTEFSPNFLPDAAISGGIRADPRTEASLSMRYIWLRGRAAGTGFSHTFGLTLGGWRDGDQVSGGLEVSALRSPASTDWIFVPGASVGFPLRR